MSNFIIDRTVPEGQTKSQHYSNLVKQVCDLAREEKVDKIHACHLFGVMCRFCNDFKAGSPMPLNGDFVLGTVGNITIIVSPLLEKEIKVGTKTGVIK